MVDSQALPALLDSSHFQSSVRPVQRPAAESNRVYIQREFAIVIRINCIGRYNKFLCFFYGMSPIYYIEKYIIVELKLQHRSMINYFSSFELFFNVLFQFFRSLFIFLKVISHQLLGNCGNVCDNWIADYSPSFFLFYCE